MKNSILVMAALTPTALIAGMIVQENRDPAALSQLTPPSEPQNEQPERLHPVTSGTISYLLQNDELNITYNKGRDWVERVDAPTGTWVRFFCRCFPSPADSFALLPIPFSPAVQKHKKRLGSNTLQALFKQHLHITS